MHGGHDQSPVCRAYYVGRNYAAHTREMSSDPDREPPLFFCKPADIVRYVADDEAGQFIRPTETKDCYCEVELMAAIDTGGCNIAAETATHHVYGYAIGLDMMRHDLQNAVEKGGCPWGTDEAFDGSAPISPIVSAKDVAHPNKGAAMLSASGRGHQRNDPLDLTWSVSKTIACPSCLFELRPGGLTYTGTPEDVGPAVAGDLMVSKTDGVGKPHVRVI